MKSNVCKINGDTASLADILKESEKVAAFNGLTHKQGLQLRLLCEEMNGMVPNIVDNYDGDFWIEYEDGVCKVNVELRFADFTVDRKKELINLASNKKNAAAVGIVGKIRSLIENMFLDKEAIELYNMSLLFNSAIEYSVGSNPSYVWSLNSYRAVVKEENVEAWDELEKSIIAAVADDVIVGVKGKKANLVIVKKFA